LGKGVRAMGETVRIATDDSYELPAYHAEPAFVARAPGRVNLLGEHVDYNDGWVMPAAIDRAAYVAGRACPSPLISVAAADLDDSTAFRVSGLEAKLDAVGQPLPRWAHYPAGVAWSLNEDGLAVSGPPGLLVAEVAAKAAMSRRGNRAFSNEKPTRRPTSKRRRFTNVRRRRRWTPA